MKITDKHTVKFDYQIKEEPKEVKVAEGRKHRQFGEDGYFYFKGTRKELHDFIKASNSELYNKAFVYTVNGKTKDWFYSFSPEAIDIVLSKYGFNWEPVYTYVQVKDKKQIKEEQGSACGQGQYKVDWSQLDGLPEKDVL